jgi:hypothetical protein
MSEGIKLANSVAFVKSIIGDDIRQGVDNSFLSQFLWALIVGDGFGGYDVFEDPDDISVAAIAVPIGKNDRNFYSIGVKVYLPISIQDAAGLKNSLLKFESHVREAFSAWQASSFNVDGFEEARFSFTWICGELFEPNNP